MISVKRTFGLCLFSFLIAFVLLFIFFAFPVFADINDQVPTESWLFQLFQFFSTVKGASVMAIAVGVAQLLMVGFQTPLANVAGKYRLLAVAGFSFLAILLGGMATGLPVFGALATAPVITALQVLFHQIYVQFFTPSGNVVPVTGQPAGK